MTIQEILDYITKTPENANVNVLSGMLDELTSGGGSEGGGDITVEALSVTENGTYTAESGKAYSPVTVNVPSDFAVAEVTITDNRSSGSAIDFSICECCEANGYDDDYPALTSPSTLSIKPGDSPLEFKAPLYKGGSLIIPSTAINSFAVITGSYEWLQGEFTDLLIKGDCDIELVPSST